MCAPTRTNASPVVARSSIPIGSRVKACAAGSPYAEQATLWDAVAVAAGGIRELFRTAREITWLVVVGIVGVAIFVFVVVLDAQLLVSALDRSGSSALWAVLAGAAAALSTVLVAVWFRARADQLGRTPRRLLGLAGIAWAVVFVVAFVISHPRGRDEESATSFEVSVVSYVLVILLAAAAVLPIAVRKLARRAPHRPDNRVQVMHIRDKNPYFVPSCDCGWVGTAYDADEPDARDNAFRDAHDHGTNVAAEVERPLG
jgi:multisubunit Na+/H+ antiporter MnhB subunit